VCLICLAFKSFSHLGRLSGATADRLHPFARLYAKAVAQSGWFKHLMRPRVLAKTQWLQCDLLPSEHFRVSSRQRRSSERVSVVVHDSLGPVFQDEGVQHALCKPPSSPNSSADRERKRPWPPTLKPFCWTQSSWQTPEPIEVPQSGARDGELLQRSIDILTSGDFMKLKPPLQAVLSRKNAGSPERQNWPQLRCACNAPKAMAIRFL